MKETLYIHEKDIIYCNAFFKRLKGMSFNKKVSNYIYCFPKCRSIHTFFMRKNIDVIITDKNNMVIKIFKNLKPWKIILPVKKGYFTYEFDTYTVKNIENINRIEKIRENL